MLTFHVAPIDVLTGEPAIPGDKSISHRVAIFAALAKGTTRISNYLLADDTYRTLNNLKLLGVEIVDNKSTEIQIRGVGREGFTQPREDLHFGNSGTGIRLFTGLMAGQSFDTCLTGDRQLLQRPMDRIIYPLELMGAEVHYTLPANAPLKIVGQKKLRPIHYRLPVPSAQVKSCILLASLYTEQPQQTKILEEKPSRNHTEILLRDFYIHENTDTWTIDIPNDISSAAFFLVAGCIAKKAELHLKNIGLNPTRTGVIDILRNMGANIHITNESIKSSELSGDIVVESTELRGITIDGELIVRAIDEFPALFIAAASAKGTTIIKGLKELRVKESDRIQTMIDALTILGVRTEVHGDDVTITGQARFKGGEIDSKNDHRVAMATTIAALRADEPIIVKNCEDVATSFPGFVREAIVAGFDIHVQVPHIYRKTLGDGEISSSQSSQ